MCRCILALCSASNGTLLPWKRRRAPTTTGAPTRGRPLVRLAQRSHGVLHKETRPDQDTSAAAAAVVPGRAKLNVLFSKTKILQLVHTLRRMTRAHDFFQVQKSMD